jgi:HK97 family phage prohead protease
MQRAYAILETKDIDEKSRKFVGVASTPNPDRMQDIVDPKGAEYKLPISLLSQHDHRLPIGFVNTVTVKSDGITIEAEIAEDTGLEYIETAWKQIKARLVRGLSIGFRALEYSFLKESDGIHFKRWEWIELSAVTIPANAEATITALKSYDQDPVKRSQVIGALSERNSRIEQATARIQRAKAALDWKKQA